MSFARVTRTQQPQQPTGIDWGNPITRGAIAAWSAVNPTQFKKSGVETGGTNLVKPSGVFRKWATGADGVDMGTSGVALPTSGDHSCFAIVVWPTSTWRWAIHFQSGGDDIAFGKANTSVGLTSPGTADRYLFAFTPTAGRTYAISYVFRRGVSVRFMAYEYETGAYFEGTEASFTPLTASGKTWVGRRTTVTSEGWADGAVQLVVPYARALANAEFRALASNPWQIFQPTARPIFVPVAAAGGSPYTLTADTANVPIAGTATGLAFNRTIIAEAASLAINGTATGLAFNRVLTADTANVAITGNAATLTYTPIGGPTYTLTADTAAVSIAGNATGLAFNRKLIAGTANTPIAGTDAGLARGYTLAADNGTLGLSASDAALIAVRKLIADSYALAVAGADATLTYTPLTLPTIGRPASDTSNTGWTASSGSDLFAMLDEVTPSATDYISASSVGAVCKMALGATAYPGTASQVLKYRASSSTGNSVIVRLKEGATTIRAETQVLTSVDTEYSITLTSGEIAAITSGSLSVELESA